MQLTQLFTPSEDETTGNGIMVNLRGQQVGRSLIPVAPLTITHPDGITGNPVLRVNPPNCLGKLIGADFNSTSDQPIHIGAGESYRIREIVINQPSATPATAAGGFYTYTSKSGYTVVAASQTYTALDDTDPQLCLAITPEDDRIITSPVIYLSLTTAEGSALTADVYIIGDVIEAYSA